VLKDLLHDRAMLTPVVETGHHMGDGEQSRYQTGLTQVAAAIRDQLGAPDVVTFDTPVSSEALADLVRQPELSSLGYVPEQRTDASGHGDSHAVLYRASRFSAPDAVVGGQNHDATSQSVDDQVGDVIAAGQSKRAAQADSMQDKVAAAYSGGATTSAESGDDKKGTSAGGSSDEFGSGNGGGSVQDWLQAVFGGAKRHSDSKH
jgi:hypothetical protein